MFIGTPFAVVLSVVLVLLTCLLRCVASARLLLLYVVLLCWARQCFVELSCVSCICYLLYRVSLVNLSSLLCCGCIYPFVRRFTAHGYVFKTVEEY